MRARRVLAGLEIQGLDLPEMGVLAYPEFGTHPSYVGSGAAVTTAASTTTA